jgi:hypothetical protein
MSPIYRFSRPGHMNDDISFAKLFAFVVPHEGIVRRGADGALRIL